MIIQFFVCLFLENHGPPSLSSSRKKENLATVVTMYWWQPLVQHKSETVKISPGECTVLWKWIQSHTWSYRMDIVILAKLQPSALGSSRSFGSQSARVGEPGLHQQQLEGDLLSGLAGRPVPDAVLTIPVGELCIHPCIYTMKFLLMQKQFACLYF